MKILDLDLILKFTVTSVQKNFTLKKPELQIVYNAAAPMTSRLETNSTVNYVRILEQRHEVSIGNLI